MERPQWTMLDSRGVRRGANVHNQSPPQGNLKEVWRGTTAMERPQGTMPDSRGVRRGANVHDQSPPQRAVWNLKEVWRGTTAMEMQSSQQETMQWHPRGVAKRVDRLWLKRLKLKLQQSTTHNKTSHTCKCHLLYINLTLKSFPLAPRLFSWFPLQTMTPSPSLHLWGDQASFNGPGELSLWAVRAVTHT